MYATNKKVHPFLLPLEEYEEAEYLLVNPYALANVEFQVIPDSIIIIQIQIPIINSEKFNLFEMIPIPIKVQDDVYKILFLKIYKYIIIDELKEKYTLYLEVK